MGKLDYNQFQAYIDGLYADGELSEQDYNDIILYILANGETEKKPRDLIQIRRGSEVNLPNLAQGELALTLDTEKLYLGGMNGNFSLPSKNNIKTDLVTPEMFGGKTDKTTDNTIAVIKAIDYAFKNKLSVQIPKFMKWNYMQVQNFTQTVIDIDSTTKVNVDTNGYDFEGGFVFNKTDKSFGIITGYDSTSVSVEQLYLGDTNTFRVGDEIEISLFKKDVVVFDDSMYDSFQNQWTAQIKIFTNSDKPNTRGANEVWSVGQYHPAFIASNTSNSSMESRASFIARNYRDGEIKNYIQMGINPLNDTEDISQIDYLFVVGNDVGGSLNTKVAMGFKQPYSDTSYLGIGGRAVEPYAIYQNHERNEINKIAFNAKSTQRTEIEFQNNKITNSVIRHWQNFKGFTGLDTIVIPTTINFLADSLYGGAMFTNEGATGGVTISLKDGLKIGTTVEVAVVKNQALRLQTINGETFLDSSTLIQSTTVGDYLRAKKISATKWVITDKNGAWV